MNMYWFPHLTKIWNADIIPVSIIPELPPSIWGWRLTLKPRSRQGRTFQCNVIVSVSCLSGPMFPGRTPVSWQAVALLVSMSPWSPWCTTSGYARLCIILCHLIPILTLNAYIPSRSTPQMVPAVGDVALSYCLQVSLTLWDHSLLQWPGLPKPRFLQWERLPGKNPVFPTIVQGTGHKAGDDQVVQHISVLSHPLKLRSDLRLDTVPWGPNSLPKRRILLGKSYLSILTSSLRETRWV